MLTLPIELALNVGSCDATSLIPNVNSLVPITWSTKNDPLNCVPWKPSVYIISSSTNLWGVRDVQYTKLVLVSAVLSISFSRRAVTRIFLTDWNPDITTLFLSSASVILTPLTETTSSGMYVEPG